MAVALNSRRALAARAAVGLTLGSALLAPAAWALGSKAPFLSPWPQKEAGTAAAPVAVGASTATAASAGARLLGVRQGPRGAALIDGVWVEVGQQAAGEARLVSVTRLGALLRHPDGRGEFLALSPDARWTLHQQPPLRTQGRP